MTNVKLSREDAERLLDAVRVQRMGFRAGLSPSECEDVLEAYLDLLGKFEGEPMIEVGKVVTREAYTGQYEFNREENVSVGMSESSISLRVNKDKPDGSRASMYSDPPANLTPQQAIDLAQILLKAAEIQTEYAEASKKLREETEALQKRYKDLISGLGTDVDIDVVDARGAFTVNKALG